MLVAERGPKGFVIDIAANDGSQLQQFRSADWKILGVEPSDVPTLLVGAHPNQTRAEIPMIRQFWSEEVAEQIKEMHGAADVIIAQNVFGHVADPIAFLRSTKTVLASDGQVIIEVPDAGEMIRNLAFDTIYHEHLSYWSAPALAAAAAASGYEITKLEHFPQIHGGTARYWLGRTSRKAAAVQLSSVSPDAYRVFAQRVSETIDTTASMISELRDTKFLAWGASAKGAVMLNAVHNRRATSSFPSGVIDQTPGKQGLFMPGVHIPVVPPPDDLSDTGVIWVLSWNWFEQIKTEARLRGFGGKFLVTSPHPQLM